MVVGIRIAWSFLRRSGVWWRDKASFQKREQGPLRDKPDKGGDAPVRPAEWGRGVNKLPTNYLSPSPSPPGSEPMPSQGIVDGP